MVGKPQRFSPTRESKSADRFSPVPQAQESSSGKKPQNGWYFWRLDSQGHRALKDVRAEYLHAVAPDEVEEDNGDSNGVE